MKLKTILLSLLGINTAFANPQDGTIAAGNVTIQQESATKLGITQTSDKAIIDWQQFNINANEHTQFYMPSASSVSLNRVVGADPSAIMGKLTANGQIFLVNPNGILFGQNAQIDVAGLVATTHNIRNQDFLAGNYNFNIAGNPNAAVINQGNIRIADTGIAAFVAPSVANHGVIAAKLGKVELAAANGFSLDFHGDNLIKFMVDDKVAKTAFDKDGKPLTSFVENAGRIEAQGGYVLLTAKGAENAIHGVINQSGVIEATTVGTQQGKIILQANQGDLKVSGTLNASAPNGGDGGFIDTSGGHVVIDPSTKITTAAPKGKTGQWLLDPTDYLISTSSNADITGAGLAGYLASNNVEIKTAPAGTGNGDIFVNDNVTWNTANKLTLTAHRNIDVKAAINAANGGSVALRADSEGAGTGTVRFANSGSITAKSGTVDIIYNPISYTDTATKSDTIRNPYSAKVTASQLNAYMLVNDVNKLQAMNTNLVGNYALGKNIDASATAGWNGGAGFVPIGGTFATPFQGQLNGLDNTIAKLNINRPATDNVGLFGISAGKISNLGLVGGNIVGNRNVGGLVGDNNGSYGISNVYSTNNVIGDSNVGGLAGASWASISNAYATGNVSGNSVVGGLVGNFNNGVQNISISNAYATGNVKGADYVGGLVGINWNTISNAYATGSVTATNNVVGGLVGSNAGVISNAHATGNVTGIGSVGGLVGHNSNIIAKSYATGSISATDVAGGLVGDNSSSYNSSTGITTLGNISDTYATGNVTITTGSSAGGLVASNAGIIKNSYATGKINAGSSFGSGGLTSMFSWGSSSTSNAFWDTTTSGKATSGGGIGLTTAQMKQQASFTGWDFTNTWQINQGVSYPTLRHVSTPTTSANTTVLTTVTTPPVVTPTPVTPTPVTPTPVTPTPVTPTPVTPTPVTPTPVTPTPVTTTPVTTTPVTTTPVTTTPVTTTPVTTTPVTTTINFNPTEGQIRRNGDYIAQLNFQKAVEVKVENNTIPFANSSDDNAKLVEHFKEKGKPKVELDTDEDSNNLNEIVEKGMDSIDVLSYVVDITALRNYRGLTALLENYSKIIDSTKGYEKVLKGANPDEILNALVKLPKKDGEKIFEFLANGDKKGLSKYLKTIKSSKDTLNNLTKGLDYLGAFFTALTVTTETAELAGKIAGNQASTEDVMKWVTNSGVSIGLWSFGTYATSALTTTALGTGSFSLASGGLAAGGAIGATVVGGLLYATIPLSQKFVEWKEGESFDDSQQRYINGIDRLQATLSAFDKGTVALLAKNGNSNLIEDIKTRTELGRSRLSDVIEQLNSDITNLTSWQSRLAHGYNWSSGEREKIVTELTNMRDTLNTRYTQYENITTDLAVIGSSLYDAKVKIEITKKAVELTALEMR